MWENCQQLYTVLTKWGNIQGWFVYGIKEILRDITAWWKILHSCRIGGFWWDLLWWRGDKKQLPHTHTTYRTLFPVAFCQLNLFLFFCLCYLFLEKTTGFILGVFNTKSEMGNKQHMKTILEVSGGMNQCAMSGRVGGLLFFRSTNIVVDALVWYNPQHTVFVLYLFSKLLCWIIVCLFGVTEESEALSKPMEVCFYLLWVKKVPTAISCFRRSQAGDATQPACIIQEANISPIVDVKINTVLFHCTHVLITKVWLVIFSCYVDRGIT